MNLAAAGRILLAVGLALVVLGGLLVLLGRAGVVRLPGDLGWKGRNVTVYVPIGLSILASLVLTLLLNLFLRR